MFVYCCYLIGRCLLFAVSCSLLVVGCVSFVCYVGVRYWLLVVVWRPLWFVAVVMFRCFLLVACRSLFVFGCSLFVVRCLLFVV